MKDKITDCRFARTCKFHTTSCIGQESSCDYVKDHETSLKSGLCPIMYLSGQEKNSCKCDIEKLRKLLPEPLKCSNGENCLARQLPEANEYFRPQKVALAHSF